MTDNKDDGEHRLKYFVYFSNIMLALVGLAVVFLAQAIQPETGYGPDPGWQLYAEAVLMVVGIGFIVFGAGFLIVNLRGAVQDHV